MQNRSLSNAEFSSVVGTIYDCALDPGQWPNAIREVCEATSSLAGVIGVSDLATGASRLQRHWNFDAAWLDRMVHHGPEIAAMLASVPNLHTRALDDPVVARRDFSPEVWQTSSYYREWLQPQGIIDAINLTVLRHKDQIGSFALSRHESAGAIQEDDIAIVRLLAPHIRRAIAVSNVLGMHAMAIGAFEASFDLLAIGMVVVDAQAAIIHANLAARLMLSAGTPVRSDRGELRTCLPETSAAVRRAIAEASGAEPTNGTMNGAAGVGIPVPQASGDPALIHVLPLGHGNLRDRIAPHAAAALFISTASEGEAPPAQAVAAVFDLSPAESRVLERLIAGRTPAEIAQDIGSALPTVRTHLSNIFAKTGTTRQVDLVRLAASLLAPVRRT
jgi:DNA-binding CsgD family transcriptional regulator